MPNTMKGGFLRDDSGALVLAGTGGGGAVIPTRQRLWKPTGYISENMGRDLVDSGSVAVLSSGRLSLAGNIVLESGVTITSIAFCTGSGALSAITNQWFCLVDQSLNVLARTVDDGATAWGANTIKSLALSSPYTPGSDIAVYCGIVVVATGVGNLTGRSSAPVSALNAVAPRMSGSSTTGLTDPASLGATAGAMTNHALVWCAVA
jgi:hypothetical protein